MSVNQIPVVGVPCFSPDLGPARTPVYAANQAYIKALVAVGLAPLMIPPVSEAALLAICSGLDGLLLPGGRDLDPSTYGEIRQSYCGAIEPERDAMELTLTLAALQRNIPIFGICRGMQTLNVACGGSLYQDIPSQHPSGIEHDLHDHPRDFGAHAISITPGSHLEAILGSAPLMVNSLHHQAAHQPGKGVRYTAFAEDGIAEGMELPDYRFALAVQFHPEERLEIDEQSRRLFAAFAEACRES